jgi:gliding motility-associated-like protein
MTSYLWQDSSVNQTLSVSKPGLYSVMVTDVNGCIGSDEVNLWALQDLALPNAFTPDGDAINDEFKPSYYSYTLSNYNLIVFNRWGEKIFESSDPDLGWDGTFQGTACQEGSYIWIIRYNTGQAVSDQSLIEMRGVVTLLR